MPKPRGEQGLASFIVVFTLVILISLISVGFSRLMDRALREASNNQLGAAADYAAQSGLNDTIALLKTGNPLLKNPITSCDTLTGPAGPLAAKSQISGADNLTKYTCVLVDPTPSDLAYQGIPAFNSQVVKLTTASPIASLLFSWQSTASPGSVNPAISGSQWLSERNWQASGRPALRVTLYSVNSSDFVTGSVTFFFYPSNAPGSPITSTPATEPDGTVVNTSCGSKSLSGFTDTAGNVARYDCNAKVTNLPAVAGTSYYYARITPLYNAADVGVQANDSAGATNNFLNVQSSVDVTARSDTAVKRIQARVATGDAQDITAGSNNMPEYTIRSAKTICKRLLVPTDPLLNAYVVLDPSSSKSDSCNFINETIAPPAVDLNATPMTVPQGNTTSLSWSTSGGPVSSCATSGGPWNSPGSRGTTGPGEASQVLNTPGPVTFSLTCTGPTGLSDTKPVTVTVAAPPTVTLTPRPDTINPGGTSTLTWTTTGATSCSAPWTGKTGPNDNDNVSPGSTTTYSITCTGPGGTATDTTTVTVTGTPPPPGEICGNGIDDNSNGQIDEGCGGPGGICPNGGNPGQNNLPDPCVQYFTASRDGSGSVSFTYRADACYNNITVSWSGGSRSLGGNSGNGPDTGFTIANPGNGAGSATIYCDGGAEGDSSASASYASFGGSGSGDPPTPACPSPPGSGPCAPPADVWTSTPPYDQFVNGWCYTLQDWYLNGVYNRTDTLSSYRGVCV